MPRKFRLETTFIAIALAAATTSTAHAAIITVGTHALLPNTPNQIFSINITGGEDVAGEDFFAQIGDGGAFNAGTDTKPVFQNIDIVNNTLFTGNNVGAAGDPSGNPPGSNAAHPLIWVDGTVTSTGAIPASGILANVTIDTTGVASGDFPLILSGVAPSLGSFSTTLRTTTGDPIPLTINNGSITIVAPEPASALPLTAAALFATNRRRRARIARSGAPRHFAP